jgi:hypothetical protein
MYLLPAVFGNQRICLKTDGQRCTFSPFLMTE